MPLRVETYSGVPVCKWDCIPSSWHVIQNAVCAKTGSWPWSQQSVVTCDDDSGPGHPIESQSDWSHFLTEEGGADCEDLLVLVAQRKTMRGGDWTATETQVAAQAAGNDDAAVTVACVRHITKDDDRFGWMYYVNVDAVVSRLPFTVSIGSVSWNSRPFETKDGTVEVVRFAVPYLPSEWFLYHQITYEGSSAAELHYHHTPDRAYHDYLFDTSFQDAMDPARTIRTVSGTLYCLGKCVRTTADKV
jgi:hypothetical protein